MYSWVKSIIIFLVLVSLIKQLLPNENYEKYIKVFIGLILIILVMKPLFMFNDQGENMRQKLNQLLNELENGETFEMNPQIENKQNEMFTETYIAQIKNQIKVLLAGQKLECTNIELDIQNDENQTDFGFIRNVRLYFLEEIKEEQKKNIRQFITSYYGVEEQQIEFVDGGK